MQNDGQRSLIIHIACFQVKYIDIVAEAIHTQVTIDILVYTLQIKALL